MPSQRKPGKKMVGFYATKEERAAIKQAARNAGMSITDWLKSLIPIGDSRHRRSSKNVEEENK